jgi:LemA protein
MSSQVVLAVVGGFLMLLALWFAMAYNRLIVLAKRCDEAFADIDVYMKQRHDLVPNLVESVKGFAGHERGIIEAITKARAAAVTATSEASRTKAETMLGTAITQIVAASEGYPEIAASGHFTRLKDEITDCENKIAASRRYLNMAVREYNATLEQMPANLVAGVAGMTARDFFDLGPTRVLFEDAPAVKF